MSQCCTYSVVALIPVLNDAACQTCIKYDSKQDVGSFTVVTRLQKWPCNVGLFTANLDILP